MSHDIIGDRLTAITPDVESTLDDVRRAWPGQEREAMVIAYNLGRRHEHARWMEKVNRAFGITG